MTKTYFCFYSDFTRYVLLDKEGTAPLNFGRHPHSLEYTYM